ncbi:prepilin peptidase [Tropicimonas sediminicola]|uniref:Prepilin peptidase CpaA n=1 Tax=Tropicimonas sediminicola TaxID=1031541 RepID=A0A239EL15_9RHOB|nr:prepilin peptidase [Tropicimonas sediminicola]SNS45081.1 prepilin peptidase CpaA [Tropicimonas sediminicola]
MELLPLLLAAPLMLWMAYGDLRYMRIPNRLVGALVLIFVLSVPFLPVESSMERLVAALFVLAVCFAAFAVGFFGGGDAKALAAMMLLIPPGTLNLFGLVLSVSIVLGLGLVLTLRAAPGAQQARWVALRARGMFPMGVSIAMAGLIHPFAVTALAF